MTYPAATDPPGAQWNPSNSTDGYAFISEWCGQCQRDMAAREGRDIAECDDNEKCEIIAASFRGEAVEWRELESGERICMAFVPVGEKMPERCAFTVDMFEVPNVRMRELLSKINGYMHEGRCPSAGCIGECAAMDEVRPGRWWAALYIWDDNFNDSARVAKWFEDAGATFVLVMHVLYDGDNGDRDGEVEGGGMRAWQVEFSMTPKA